MIRRLLILAALLPLPARAVAATIEGRDLGGGNLICGPGSAAGDSIPCSPNDVLSGVFTNVGLFQVNAGTTVFVTPSIPLIIFASTISIPGTLNGSGRGEVGGIGGDPGQPGGNGAGRGPGIGAYTEMGGGGGAYGGNGGDGSGTDGLLGVGGAAYDNASLPVSTSSIYPGSGGGGGGGSGTQTGGSGGQGGASIYLEASSFTLTGTIFVRGVPGGNSTRPADAGGGGAGGGLLLRCMDYAAVGGSINASGGKGGDAIAGGVDVPYPGGGGGGGRVKIYYRQADFSVIISTAGGAKGVKSANGPEGWPNAQAGSTGTVSYGTVAFPPSGLTFQDMSATAISWNWTAAPDWGNAAEASRKYRLYSGTVSYRTQDRLPQLVASSDTLSATETGLTPNTAYTRYVTAFTDHSDSLPSNPVSTYTLAGLPGAAASTFTALTAYSLSLNWGAGEPANPGYTIYEVNRSTDIDSGVDVSTSYITALSSAPVGLTPNTTYYFRVRAINMAGLPTGFTSILSTATLAAEPAAPSLAGVGPTGFNFSWNGGSNPPQTRYIAEISTDNFATLSRSSSTFNTGASFTGLAVNTLYYARVKAQNHNGLDTAFTAAITTVTATAPPVNAPVPFTNLSYDSLTFNWDSGGNSAGTNYNAEISTNSGFSVPVSSAVTTNLNYDFTGLSVNATYYARVRALGTGGLASLYSSPAVSTVTLTLPPVAASPPFTGVFAGSFIFSWENGGNPDGTLYGAEISKDGFVSVSSAVLTSALSVNFSALEANTVYQARVRAVSFAGIPGQYSSPIVSTATAISPAVNVASPFQNLSANALAFNWESGGNSAGTSYNPEISTSSDFSAPVSSAVTTSLNYLFTGLSANATYYAHVRAIGVGGNPTPYAQTVSTVTYTLAPDLPASPFSGISTAGFALSWNTGGNPPNTRYAAEISRDSFATVITSASTLSTSSAFAGLAPNTIYQVRAKAFNFLGVEGPYSSPIRSTTTLAAPPLNAEQPFTAVSASTFTFTWGDGGNPGGTSYAVEISSSAFAPGTAVSSAATLALSQTFSGLLANTTYYARVKAVNMDNVPSGYAAAVTAVTLPLSPALAAPPFSGVTSSGLTLGWTASGNPANTTYVAEISRDGFVSISGSVQTNALSAPFAALTSNTVYQARVHAVNFAGIPGQYSSPIVSTATAISPAVNVASPFQNLSANALAFNWESGGNSAGTSYNPEISTSSDFAAPVSSAVTTSLNYLFTGLSANATYYAHVRAIGVGGNPTAYTGAVSTVTYTLAPDLPASPFSGISVSGFTLSWATGGNPPNTRYAAEISRDGFVSVSSAVRTSALSAVFSALAANTVYQARVWAINFAGIPGQYSSAIVSTATASSAPLNSAMPFQNLSANALTFNWEPDGNSAGTSYNPEISTSSDFAAPVSSAVTTSLNYLFTGLSVNATYYARVRALGTGGSASPYSSPAVSTVTLTLPPVPAATPFTEVLGGSFTFSWQNGGNPAGTVYTAEISRDGFVSVSGSVQTSALNAPFAALTSNTVYQARVHAVNFAGIPGQYSSPIVSTATAISPAVNAALPFQNLSANALTFNWESGGNSAGTSYNPEISTSSDFAAPVSSAVTTSLNYLFTSLSVNTTYYAHIRAIGVGGNPTPYAQTVSTVTYTLAPVVPTSPFTGVSPTGFTLSWNTGGNPPNTRYAAEISRDGFVSVSSAVRTSALSAVFSALAANTVYQARVWAVNFAGISGQYSSAIVSTSTASSAPLNTAAPFQNLSANALTFNWDSGGNSAGTSYNPEISTSSDFSTPVSSAVTTSLNYLFTGLSVNTTYYAHIRAIGVGGNPTSYAQTVSTVTYTLAPVVPASPFSGVSTTGFTLGWNAGGNPQNTRYASEISRDSFATLISSSSTLSTSAAFSGLAPNTIYQVRAKAINFLGVESPYTAPVRSTTTLAASPLNAGQSFTGVSASTFTFTWGDGGNPGGTSYAIEISSAAFAPGTAVSSAATLALSQTFSGLLANTTYQARVKAVNMDNVPSGYAAAVTAVTLPLSPALAALPFSGVTSSGLTLGWTANGNPQGTTYVAELSRDNFVTISLSSTTRNIPAAFMGLTPNTTYTARIRAVNFAGDYGPYSSPVVSTATLAVPPESAVPPLSLTDSGLTALWLSGGNPPGTLYEAEVSTRPGFETLWASASVSGLSANFALAPNTTYYARARARNYNGVPTALVVVGGGLATYAALPAVAASTAPGPVSITTFSFTNTVYTGTGGLLFYRTVWDRNATHTWNDQEPGWTATGVMTTTATGNGYWYLHLRSYNVNGLGYKTADIGPFHVALSTVIPPGQPVPVPGAFTATSGITWNWPPAIAFGETLISTYVVSVGTTPFDFNVLTDFAVGPLASFTLDPAANGRIYYLKVRAIDEGGILSQYSPASSPGVLVDRSVPGRPGAVQADRKFSYDSNLLFSWSPAADGESGIKAYLLDVGTSLYGTDIYNAKNLGQELSYQATGLPGGKSVYARVRAENNAGGFSDYSELGPGIPVLPLDQTPPMTQPYNWPNPFDPAGGPTQIGFFLKAPARVTLKLFTLEGNLVYEETRAEGAAGNKVWPWTGRNGTGRLTAPGGYICLIEKRYSGKTERQQFKLAVLY